MWWLLQVVVWVAGYLLFGLLFHHDVNRDRSLAAVESAVVGVSVLMLVRYFFQRT
jgi:hypothetical protein